ncbi:MAG: RraA family protein [Ginsengibacter sp.]
MQILADRLQACYSGAVFDVLRAMGFTDQTLPGTIRPLDVRHQIAGRVFTIEGKRVEGMDADQTLLKWCELLSKAPADSIVVCQPNDNELAYMGELSSETLHYKNVRGYIVDGGCRDSAFIERMGFPVFCKYYTPVDIVCKWIPIAYGQPVKIGTVTINTDDYLVADRDGIIIIPGEIAEEVVIKTEEVLQTENLVRKAILMGIDPVEAFLKYRKF